MRASSPGVDEPEKAGVLLPHTNHVRSVIPDKADRPARRPEFFQHRNLGPPSRTWEAVNWAIGALVGLRFPGLRLG